MAFTGGRYRAAAALARQAAEAAVGLNRHAALVLAARSALWARDAKTLAACWTRCGPNRSRVARRHAACARSRPAQRPLSGGAGAKARYRNAIAGWEDLDLPLPLLFALVERKTFLSGAHGHGEPADRELIERLGANGLKRLVGA